MDSPFAVVSDEARSDRIGTVSARILISRERGVDGVYTRRTSGDENLNSGIVPKVAGVGTDWLAVGVDTSMKSG
jgi:hypothetical protein